MSEPIIPIMSDIPIANQYEIYAAVMWVAERRNIPFHKAFILCMDRYAKLLVMAAIDDISVDEVVEKLYPKESK